MVAGVAFVYYWPASLARCGRGVLAAGRKAAAEFADDVLAGDPTRKERQR